MRSNAKKIFKTLQNKFSTVIRDAPKVLANEGTKIFGENFRKQEYEGHKWKEVERREPGTFSYKYPKSKDLGRRTRPILIGKTRKLRTASISSVRYASIRRIKWGNYLSYAEKQNETRPFMKVGPQFKIRLAKKYASMYKNIK